MHDRPVQNSEKNSNDIKVTYTAKQPHHTAGRLKMQDLENDGPHRTAGKCTAACKWFGLMLHSTEILQVTGSLILHNCYFVARHFLVLQIQCPQLTVNVVGKHLTVTDQFCTGFRHWKSPTNRCIKAVLYQEVPPKLTNCPSSDKTMQHVNDSKMEGNNTTQCTIRLGGSRSPNSTTKVIQDSCGASRRRSGQWPVPRPGMTEWEENNIGRC